MTKKRIVFGRIKKRVDDTDFTFSMKADGVHVRKYRSRTEVTIPFGHLSVMAKKQLEFML